MGRMTLATQPIVCYIRKQRIVRYRCDTRCSPSEVGNALSQLREF
jgi:hypothetical protein